MSKRSNPEESRNPQNKRPKQDTINPQHQQQGFGSRSQPSSSSNSSSNQYPDSRGNRNNNNNRPRRFDDQTRNSHHEYNRDHDRDMNRSMGNTDNQNYRNNQNSERLYQTTNLQNSNRNPSTRQINLNTNFYKIEMIPGRMFTISSISFTCAEKTEEWQQLDSNDKEWLKRMLSYDRFKSGFLFHRILNEKKTSWESGVKGFPVSEGSMIVSTKTIPHEKFVFSFIRYRREDDKIEERKFPVQVCVQNLPKLSIERNIGDKRIEQAVSVCTEMIFNQLKMIKFGLAHVKKIGVELDDKYLIRNGIISSLSSLKSGFYMSLSFKQKITSIEPMIVTLYEEMKKEKNKLRISEKFTGLTIVFKDRSFIIKDIDFQQNPLSTFKVKGKDITYIQYYQEKHGIKIKDHSQPLIYVMVKLSNQQKVKNYLIPELCYVSGIAKKDFRNISKRMNYKSIWDKERFVNETLLDMTKGEAKALADSAGFKINVKPMRSEARILSRPVIKFGSSKAEISDKFKVPHQALENVLNGKKWILAFDDYACANCFESEMVDKYGAEIPELMKIENVRKNKDWKDVKYILVLMNRNNDQMYSELKSHFNCRVGIPSQFIICNNGWKKRIFNCAIQIAAKVGGIIWETENPNSQVYISSCGIDLQKRGRNYKGSVAASLNRSMTLYHTIPFEENDPLNAKSTLISCIIETLESYSNRNGGKPHFFLIYNSGNDLLDISSEIPNLYKKFPSTQFCLIGVNQNSNVRFHNDHENPSVGTVVTSLSRVDMEEFYLNSCSIPSAMGYSKPVRYEILFKFKTEKIFDFTFDMEKIIEITYKQTYLYYNWNGSVKLPACLLYAKKSTEAKSLTRENPKEELSKLPYYL